MRRSRPPSSSTAGAGSGEAWLSANQTIFHGPGACRPPTTHPPFWKINGQTQRSIRRPAPPPLLHPKQRKGFHATCGRFAPSIAAPIRQQPSSSWCGTSSSTRTLSPKRSGRTRAQRSSFSTTRIENGPIYHPSSQQQRPARPAQSLASGQPGRDPSIHFVVCRRASSPSTWTPRTARIGAKEKWHRRVATTFPACAFLMLLRSVFGDRNFVFSNILHKPISPSGFQILFVVFWSLLYSQLWAISLENRSVRQRHTGWGAKAGGTRL